MTNEAVIAEIRSQTSDTLATYRYSDVDLYAKMNAAQTQIASDHPEALCSDTAVVTSISAPIGADQIPVLNDLFFMALVHMTCHLIFLDDSEDTGNARLADKHLGLYERSIT